MSALQDMVIDAMIAFIALVLLALALHHWVSAARSAEALLREFLTPAEYQQLRSTGYLGIASSTHPGRAYRIPRGQGRVQILEDGRPTEQLCLQPVTTDLPAADVVLIHKLLIQADEDFYLGTANHFQDLAQNPAQDPFWWLASCGQIGPGGCRIWP